MCIFGENLNKMSKSAFKSISCTLLFVALLSACGSKYNKIKFPDPNEGNSEVYGNVGGEPLTVAEPSKADPAVGEVSKEAAPKFREQIEAGIQK